ncbi:hypothetical protein LK09_18615 [Microbacterium mangrovi]|uniref:Uncharacterized protein n=1 Tax=Microbacterium mangrovi TaxID=1348253 RepID=A0A0B2A1K8_9MICO|nr:hypothetical protein [Microbacterium mangrovi]KHK95679.1 hypothetical protein LK09_18615 [Microbacterium mangrovi]
MSGDGGGGAWVMRVLSAIVLLVVGGIHVYLVFHGVGGILGVMFVLNGIAGLVLAIGMLTLRGRLLKIAVVLSLLFVIATLSALLLALTVGLFGIHEVWTFTLVPQTIVIESVGIVVLAVACGVLLRRPRVAARAVPAP